jgi:helix-turn-helix protein
VRIRGTRKLVPRADRESLNTTGTGCIIGGTMPRKGEVDKELREKIAKLLKAGKSQAEIGRMINRVPGAIAYHVRALGIAPKRYSELLPMKHGKRRCGSCRKMNSRCISG